MPPSRKPLRQPPRADWADLLDVVPESARAMSDASAILPSVNGRAGATADDATGEQPNGRPGRRIRCGLVAPSSTEEKGALAPGYVASQTPPDAARGDGFGGLSESARTQARTDYADGLSTARALAEIHGVPLDAMLSALAGVDFGRGATGQNIDWRTVADGPAVAFEPQPKNEEAKRALLTQARALVARGWSGRHVALDAEGRPCFVDSSEAVAWSLVGALNAAPVVCHPIYRHRARGLLTRLACGFDLPGWEEHPFRTQDDVLDLLDRALAEVGGPLYVPRQSMADELARLRAEVARLSAAPTQRRAMPSRSKPNRTHRRGTK